MSEFDKAPRIVVVGMDFSPLSDAALLRALRLTEGAPYATIHAVVAATRAGQDAVLPDGTRLRRWAALDAIRIMLAETVRQWPYTGPENLRVVGHVRVEAPEQAILRMADSTRAETIVVGAHSGPTNRLGHIGRVARGVLDEAPTRVHVEAPITTTLRSTPRFDPMRWAFVFGTTNQKARDELALQKLIAGTESV